MVAWRITRMPVANEGENFTDSGTYTGLELMGDLNPNYKTFKEYMVVSFGVNGIF
jgi:hypothetical protein